MIEFVFVVAAGLSIVLAFVFSPFWVSHARRCKALRDLEAMGFVVDQSPSRAARRELVECVTDVIPAVGVFGIRWIARGAVDGRTIVVFEHLQASLARRNFDFKTIIIAEFARGSRFDDFALRQMRADTLRSAFAKVDRGGLVRHVKPETSMHDHISDSRLILESNDLPLVGETAEYIRRCAKLVELYEA